jgi:parvulin-like peptidyl-prolyl isomerase
MRSQWFVPILLVCLAYGQAAAPAPAGQPAQTPAPPAAAGQPAQPGQAEQSAGAAAAPAATPKPAEVAPTDPVITLKGLCQDPSKEGSACQTVLTREQFERLADALQPNMSPSVKRQLASAYAKMLAMSMAAEKKGLDKQPQFEQMLGFARMQILSQVLSRNLQEESQKVTDEDLEKYYNDNKPAYDEADFQRIYIPKTKQAPPPPKPASAAAKTGSAATTGAAGKTSAAAKKPLSQEEQQKAGEAAMKKVAESLHARAAAGEDFEKLQKEAYLAAGIKGNAPQVKMEKTRRTALPATQGAVFDLKPGAISELLTEPSGYYIYKMVSKQTLPLDKVKAEIKNTLSGQRYRDSLQVVQQQGTPELNNAYFGAPRPPGMPLPPNGGKPQQPPSEPDPD